MKKAKINVEKVWDAEDVRKMCIKSSYYTRGDCEAYRKMLTFVSKHKPTTGNIYQVAEDIAKHSEMSGFTDDEAVELIMFKLDRECVTTCYEIERA